MIMYLKDDNRKLGKVSFLFVSSVIGLINSFFFANFYSMIFLCIIEVFVLFYFLLCNKYIEYLSYYTIFLCFSMESATYVGTSNFYGFKNFRILGLNLAIWMIIPIFILAIKRYHLIKNKIGKDTRSILLGLAYFILLGFFMSIITYAINDNNFQRRGNPNIIIEQIYSYFIVFVYMLSFITYVMIDYEKVIILKELIFHNSGTAVVFVFCFYLKFGNRRITMLS